MFNFTQFLRQKWAESSASSGQKGTVIDELAVKPTGLVLSDFYNSLVNERAANDITNWQSMTEQQLDFFGNKFFMKRNYGSYASGVVRIWFDQRVTIEIPTSTIFTSTAGTQFAPVQPGFINKDTLLRSTTRFALYYIDIPVVAVNMGSNGNINAGDITQINGVKFTYKMVTNPDPFVGGAQFENNQQYYTRLLYSINDRSMMTKKSLCAKLPEFFPIIKSVYVAGAGNGYMTRDLVEAISASEVIKRADYLGKISGNNMVKSTGFYQIFPNEAGNANNSLWGPLSIPTLYNYPLSIEPSDLTSTEPALHGYALNQECTNDMYQGMYFDDFKTNMQIATQDLFNINNEGLTYQPVLVPSSDWVYGAHGYANGTLGPLANGVADIDVLNFSNNNISISGGALNSVSVGKDINKRAGLKLSGTFTWPASAHDDPASLALNSNLQVMVAGTPFGVYDTRIDGYTGVGFGIRVTSPYPTWNPLKDVTAQANNASIYFAHCARYMSANVFFSSADETQYSIGQVQSLQETRWRIEPGAEYEFEFIFDDTFNLTLYLNKVIPNTNDTSANQNVENHLYFKLTNSTLNVFGNELSKPDSTVYGTTMKVTLDTTSQLPTDTWIVKNLRAFDMASHRATAMFALNVADLESPLTLSARATATSAVNNLSSSGYLAYIWDTEAQSIATGTSELTAGAWSELADLSNSDGSKDVLSNLLTTQINNANRYVIQNRFGNNIFLMFATTGTTLGNSRYAGRAADDVQSVLNVDYVKAESGLTTAYHANNKADIYLTTLSNNENLSSTTITLTKNTTDSYFEMSAATGCNMPVADILSVGIGQTINQNQVLSQTDYSVVGAGTNVDLSANEVLKIYLLTTDSDTITVEYTTYPAIQAVQSFFDGPDYGKVYGDILIRHKYPAELSFVVYFSGNASSSQLITAIKTYFDEQVTDIFVIKDMITYLYNNNYANNILEPITVSYSQYNDQGQIVRGTFTDFLKIRDVDYFRLVSVSTGSV